MNESEISKLSDAINALAQALIALAESKSKSKSNAPAASVEADTHDAEDDKGDPTPAPETNIDCPITYSEQNVKDATLAASRAGHKDAIREKLAEYKAKRIQQLTSDQTIDFMDWLATLDNKS